jgi:glycosyltransferase involved in cell wall biosynthesis
MRILHISTRLILGGSQENTVLSCEGQARLGHDVRLAFGPIYGPEGSLLERVEEFNRRCGRGQERTRAGSPCHPITTHLVPHLEREIMPLTDRRCYGELRRLVRELRPDIVHTHSSKAGILGRAAAWDEVYQQGLSGYILEFAGFAREARQPEWPMGIVHTIHGSPFHPYQSRLKNALYIVSERFAARRCHVIVSVADAMTRQYLNARIGRAEQYVTVLSGMETERFLTPEAGEMRDQVRARLGLAPGDFVIGTVARLAELKGHDDLLEALGADLNAHPSWKLLWVGDGWWKDRLLGRVRELGLAGQVITTGLVPPSGPGGVPGFIRAMDVLAHPSYREGLPRTVPQALLCGVCPVAYDVDGTGEVCRDGQTGRLVKPGDRAALREAIVWLAEHPRERAEMAEGGRAECAVRFSAEAMVEALERVYRRAIEAAGTADG